MTLATAPLNSEQGHAVTHILMELASLQFYEKSYNCLYFLSVLSFNKLITSFTTGVNWG